MSKEDEFKQRDASSITVSYHVNDFLKVNKSLNIRLEADMVRKTDFVMRYDNSVASVMGGASPSYNLGCLFEQDSLFVFLIYAFVNIELVNQHPQLKKILEIVKTCVDEDSRESKTNDEGEWMYLRDHDISALKERRSS